VVLSEVGLAKVPVPEVDQVAETAVPPMVPTMGTTVNPQTLTGAPAFTVGAALIVTVIASLTGVQGPAGLPVVRVRVLVPAVMSAALGVYVVFRDVALAKVPVPLLVQITEGALPPIVPVRVTTGEVAHTI
jgi:hypothetical protein